MRHSLNVRCAIEDTAPAPSAPISSAHIFICARGRLSYSSLEPRARNPARNGRTYVEWNQQGERRELPAWRQCFARVLCDPPATDPDGGRLSRSHWRTPWSPDRRETRALSRRRRTPNPRCIPSTKPISRALSPARMSSGRGNARRTSKPRARAIRARCIAFCATTAS